MAALAPAGYLSMAFSEERASLLSDIDHALRTGACVAPQLR